MTNNHITGMSPLERLEEINLPFCEFSLSRNPSEWLSKEAIDELWRIGKSIFADISLEINEGEYFCNSLANRAAPENHRQLLWNMVFHLGERWKDFLNGKYKPSKIEDEAFCIMERLLLEGAFYLAWNYRNKKKGFLPSKYWFDCFDEMEDDFDYENGPEFLMMNLAEYFQLDS